MSATVPYPWPAGCREVVATLHEGSPEAGRVIGTPHHRATDDFLAVDFSPSLRALVHQVGERASSVGRAFSARIREDPRNPFSAGIEVTPAERAAGLDRTIRITTEDPAAAERLAHLLVASGLAESSHPVVAQIVQTPHQAAFVELPTEQPGSWAFHCVHGDEALDLEPGDPEVVVGVLDTGIDGTHPEFAGKLVSGYNFVEFPPDTPGLVGHVTTRGTDTTDDAGHGTHVAGVIGARGLKMHRGLAGNCKLMSVRVLGTTEEYGQRVGIGIVQDIDDGLKYAVDQGVRVVNMSLGMHALGPGLPHQRAIEYAHLNDVVCVAAAGNDGTSQAVYPGDLPGVLTVGAITELNQVAPFSSWGPFLDVTAPGVSIYSTDRGGGYRYRIGTSHAAPLVTAVAALLCARARRHGFMLRERTVRRIIRDTADNPGTRRTDLKAGAGCLNALDAVLMLSHLMRDRLSQNRWMNAPDDARLDHIRVPVGTGS